MLTTPIVTFHLEFPTEEERKKKGDPHSCLDLPCFLCGAIRFNRKLVALGVRVFYAHSDTEEDAQAVCQLFGQCALHVQREGRCIRIGVCEIHISSLERLHEFTSTDHCVTQNLLKQAVRIGEESHG